MKKVKYYQLTISGKEAILNIYGDITSWPWLESDVSSYNIKQEIDNLDVDTINVFINSYGGEVAEALAIYSALKRNKAKITTYCDGFACSAASIIFCAGDVRVMGALGLLMIHNAMSYVGYANSEGLRKAAEDNDKINQSSIEAYKKVCNLSEDKIRELMDNESWITASEALEMGFATEIAEQEESEGPVQSVRGIIRQRLITQMNESLNDKMISEKLDKIISFFEQSMLLDVEQKSKENTDDNRIKSSKMAAAFFHALSK